MQTRARPLLASTLLVALTGCTGIVARNANQQVGSLPAATILHADQLSRAPTLLGAITARLPGVRVQSGTRQCPEITLRGRKSITGENSPAVYVDGTRAVNTCVLDMLNAVDVSRVEIYPIGIAPRLPYRGHPNGLILVFLADGRV